MKAHLSLTLVMLFAAGCASPATEDSRSMPSPDSMMPEGAMPMPQPTAEHLELQSSVGVWEGTLTSFMPGVPAEPVPAREVVRSAGPFWVDSEFTCDFMGMPYTGMGSMGFDAMTGRYRGTWRDNMTGFLNVMEGEKRGDNTIVNRWQAPDMTGAMADHVSEHIRHDADSYTMNFTMNGEPSMVIEMKRVSRIAP